MSSSDSSTAWSEIRMSENIGYKIGEAIVVEALREVLVERPEQKQKIRAEIARLEKANPRTVEAFEEREARIKELLEELHKLGGY